MTDDQLATIAKAARFLRSNAAALRAEREGAGSIRAALGMLQEAGVAAACADAYGMIRASLKAYGQGNDRSAASHADTAAERLEALVPQAA